MKNKLYTLQEVKSYIESGATGIISGYGDLLKQLPKGNWIGATTARFLDVDGGIISEDKLFITDLSDYVTDFKIKLYDENQIPDIFTGGFDNGFQYILIPMQSKVHMKYGTSAFTDPNLFANPIVGWIADANPTAMVVNGKTGEMSNSLAVVMHCRLPENKRANLEIVSPFVQGDGDTFVFTDYSFDVTACYINGKLENALDYWKKNNIDMRLPLVTNISGASINVSLCELDEANRTLKLAAAVIPGMEYKIARQLPDSDYTKAFKANIPAEADSIVSFMSCYLNFEYMKLKGQKLGNLTGPFGQGEIAYLLLNQTTVYLYIKDVDK